VAFSSETAHNNFVSTDRMFLLVKLLQRCVILWLYNFVLLSSHGSSVLWEQDEISKCV
jgi:hypothetical protein